MLYDLVPWFRMPSVSEGNLLNGKVYGRETHHLEGVTLDGVTAAEKAYHVDTGYSLKFIKGSNGFPVEIKPYDSEYIYDRTTENGWTSPRDFKQFNPMLAMCPRFWDGLPFSPPLVHPISTFETWQNCAKIATSTVGQAAYDIIGPVNVDFRGDVGVTPSIVLRYRWNGAGSLVVYQDREELYLTQKVGWCWWTHAKMTPGGVYQIDKATLHNKIVLGGPPVIQFPCLQIP